MIESNVSTQEQVKDQSLKLLNSYGTPCISFWQHKPIRGLDKLSKRIKAANDNYKQDSLKHQTFNNYLLANDIDLNKDILVVREAKYRHKIEQARLALLAEEQKLIQEEEISLEENMEGLACEEFLLKVQQMQAYRSIFETINGKYASQDEEIKSDNALKQIKMRNVNRMKNLKQDNRNLSQRIKQRKVDLNEVVTKFATLVDLVEVTRISQTLYKRFLCKKSLNRSCSERWLGVLFMQNQMLNKIEKDMKDTASQAELEKLVTNHLSTASIEALNVIFKAIYKRSHDLFQQNYFSNKKYDENAWAEWYFMLRSSEEKQFLEELKKNHQRLYRQFQKILRQLNHFQRPDAALTKLELHQDSSHFQKLLKLVALGKNANIFDNLSLGVRALQQPWFILITLAFNRSSQKQQKLRVKHLNDALSDFYTNLIDNAVKAPLNHQLVINFATGLISLGKLTLLNNLFNQLTQKCQLRQYECYFDFVHIFIVLAANPGLVYAHVKGLEAEEVITKSLKEIVDYLRYLKRSKPEYFRSYFKLLQQIFVNLSKKRPTLSLQNIIQQLYSSLFVKFEDLKFIGRQDLQFLQNSDQVLKLIQKNIIKHVQPQNQQQYIELAQFCDSISQLRLKEHILVKFIIFNFLETEELSNKVQKSSIFERGSKQDQNGFNQTTINRNITITEDYLSNNMALDRKDILNFIKTVKKIKNYVILGKKYSIKDELRQLSRYRRSNERIFEYLHEIDPSQKSGVLGIFVSYYQYLHRMYRLFYLACSNVTRYEDQRLVLLEELKQIKSRHPKIVGNLYNRVVQEIKNATI